MDVDDGVVAHPHVTFMRIGLYKVMPMEGKMVVDGTLYLKVEEGTAQFYKVYPRVAAAKNLYVATRKQRLPGSWTARTAIRAVDDDIYYCVERRVRRGTTQKPTEKADHCNAGRFRH